MGGKFFFALVTALTVGAALAEAVTGWSGPITVDNRAPGDTGVRTLAPAPIGYCADWVLGKLSPNAHCVLVKTANPDVPGSVDETVVTSAAGASGTYDLEVGAKGERIFRFVLQAYEGSTLLGSLTREVALGLCVQGVDELVDTTADKLQHVVDDGALTADLQCDTSWVQGAASAVISKTRTPWLSKRHRGAPVTTTEATFMAPFDGLHTYAIPQNEGADYEFGLVFKDASDNPIGEPMTACYSKSCTFGLSLTIR